MTLSRASLLSGMATPPRFPALRPGDRARNLLEGSEQALKAVAFDCGFGGAEQMRAVFQRRLGVGPAQYRASFRRG